MIFHLLKDFIMQSEHQEDDTIKNNISKILRASGYRNEYVAKQIGLTAPDFILKKKQGTWSVEEIEKIIEVITSPNENAMDAIMLEIMRSRKNDEVIPLEEFKAEIATWK